MSSASSLSSSAGKWTAWLAAALLLYVLSIGPVCRVLVRHYPPDWGWKVLDTVYQPLVWACEKTSCSLRLTKYEMWWEGPEYNVAGFTYIRRRPGDGPLVMRDIIVDRTAPRDVNWAGQ